MKYVCELCGMIYNEELGDPKGGIAPGTAFADVPEDYACPGCGSLKEAFNKAEPKVATAAKPIDRDFWNNTKYSDHKESDK